VAVEVAANFPSREAGDSCQERHLVLVDIAGADFRAMHGLHAAIGGQKFDFVERMLHLRDTVESARVVYSPAEKHMTTHLIANDGSLEDA